jgi:hypothetical protein
MCLLVVRAAIDSTPSTVNDRLDIERVLVLLCFRSR